ncbi:MAG TPA: FHA domain-containing protein [Kofleriaceae bacterium]|nr:FHA domain-containing protein [Kofleriaceae bacterium]
MICSITSTDLIGVLCGRCSALIAGSRRRAPGIVSSRVDEAAAAAWLIDAWGQLHPLAERSRIGRDALANELVIADLAVSGEHAELRREGDRWTLVDRGSANGSGIGRSPRVRQAEPEHRAHLWFGGVAFYFWADPEPPARDVAPPAVRTLVPAPAAFQLTAAGAGELLVRAARGHPIDGAPGELEYRAPDGSCRRAPLPRLQFQLLRALCEAAIGAGDSRAGALASHELLMRLPFQTPRPEPNHVRQVVSTLRAALGRAGVPGGGSAGPDGLIHAADGAGYRLTWTVCRMADEHR